MPYWQLWGGCQCWFCKLILIGRRSAEKGAVKQTWTEEQDEELRMLFYEFTQLPPDAASEHGQLSTT